MSENNDLPVSRGFCSLVQARVDEDIREQKSKTEGLARELQSKSDALTRDLQTQALELAGVRSDMNNLAKFTGDSISSLREEQKWLIRFLIMQLAGLAIIFVKSFMV